MQSRGDNNLVEGFCLASAKAGSAVLRGCAVGFSANHDRRAHGIKGDAVGTNFGLLGRRYSAGARAAALEGERCATTSGGGDTSATETTPHPPS